MTARRVSDDEIAGASARDIAEIANAEPRTGKLEEPVAKPRSSGAPGTTIEALMLTWRERGSAALLERVTRQRLSELSSDQIRDVIKRLHALQPHYPQIDAMLLSKLEAQL
jgi:hypothetical protein